MRVMVPEHLRRSAIVGDYRGDALATVMVVDAEGSTRLAERLRPHGNAGAEALADVLSTVFAPMVRHVTGLGGFVAEFAGDGIIGVFPGEADHAVPQAVAAAMRILADLADAAAIATPDGPASLNLRAVVECGTVEWVVWTSPRSDLGQNAAFSFFGAAIDAAQAGERITPGDVLAIGPNARRHLPDGVTTTELKDGFAAVEVTDPSWARLDPRVDVAVADEAHRFFPDDLAHLDRESSVMLSRSSSTCGIGPVPDRTLSWHTCSLISMRGAGTCAM